MGQPLVPSPWDTLNRQHFKVEDEFNYFVDADLWTVHSDANSTAAHEGPGRGRFKLYGITTDNADASIATTNELFLWAADKPMHCAALVQYAEGATSAVNFAFGWADALGADLIADDGASVGIANEGALIYKLDGGTVWRFTTEMATAATDSVSTTTAGGSTAQLLEIDIVMESATVLQARPFVDGQQLIDSTTNKPICHRETLSSPTDMDFGAYLKIGTTGAESVYIDYMWAAQAR